MTRKRQPEAGYTLPEVLVAVVILAVGIGALLAAMSSSILGSSVHSSLVTTDALTRAYAEQLASNTTTYMDCAITTTYPAMQNVPAGYVVRITNVEYGDGANPTAYAGGTGPLDQCQINGDKGTQRITLEAHFGAPGSTTGRGQQYLQVIKRKP